MARRTDTYEKRCQVYTEEVHPWDYSAKRTPLAPIGCVQRTIERNDWARFFESFTMQHDHWLVRVDGERDSLPLEGIATRDDGNLVVTLGGNIAHHRRIVIDPKSVRVEQQDGVDRGIEIESNDGHTTRLEFRSPMPPELVDGIAP